MGRGASQALGDVPLLSPKVLTTDREHLKAMQIVQAIHELHYRL